jgi:F5/8 type C domain/Bacterial Ig domain
MEQGNNVVLPMRFNRLTTILLSAAFTTMLILIALHVVSTENDQAYSIPSNYNVSAQKQYDSSKVCDRRVPIMGLTSSSSERGNPPGNTIDRNLNTRWSNHAVGKYIQADLGSVKTICEASIAWFRGDTRQYLFVISTSHDGLNYHNVFKGISSGHTLQPENYPIHGTDARYIKIIVSRNIENNWASISEITLYGLNTSTNPPPSVNHSPTVSNGTSITISQDTAAIIPIIVSDPDQGDSATITNKSAPAHGNLSLGPTQNSFVYRPISGYSGPDSFTIQATDNHGAPSNIATVSIIVTSSTSVGGTGGTGQGFDKFGIKEIYPTKPGGEQWFMNMQDPNHDKQTNPPSMSKNPDGSFKVTSTQVRYAVSPMSGYNPSQIKTTNQKTMIQQGYMQSPGDWKNVELTGYFKVNSFTSSTNNGAAHIELLARGGVHTSSKSCEGTAYHSNLYETGRSKFEKELEHTAGYTTNDPEKSGATNKLDGRWIGLKAVFFTRADGTVKLEQWIDDGSDNISTPGNKWHKSVEFVDNGNNWGGGHPNCGGTDKTMITWGGPLTHFRWDNIDNMDIKFFTVREIQPPTIGSPTTPVQTSSTSNNESKYSPPSVVIINPYIENQNN